MADFDPFDPKLNQSMVREKMDEQLYENGFQFDNVGRKVIS